MMAHQAALNRVWTQVMLEALYRQGVRHLCIAPGSRSTPLTLEAVDHGGFTLHSHFDERGLGFLALGLAKATNNAVAVIVTSGTAVANLLPAVAESMLTKERLILLTSDRPIELVECGANQAIVQTGIFSNHVTKYVGLPSPNTTISLNWLLTTIDSAFVSQQQNGGSIHINCPYPEPLYGGEDQSMFQDYRESIRGWLDSDDVYVRYERPVIRDYAESIQQLNLGAQKGVILVGNTSLSIANQAATLAQSLGWPIVFDPQSGQGGDWQHYDLWLQNQKANHQLSHADFVLQVGARFVSKRLNQWLSEQVTRGTRCVLLTEHLDRLNPDHIPMTHLLVDIEQWLREALALSTPSQHAHWGDELKRFAIATKALSVPAETISEFDVAKSMQVLPKGIPVFLGNSLIVRLVDMLSSINGHRTYSNRGASGIDGLVATASGVARAEDLPIVMYLGDTSLLYDLNSLALFSRATKPHVIVVTNNDGGAIFDLLPVPLEQKVACYQMPHGFTFQHAAAQFGLDYCQPQSNAELESILLSHLANGTKTLLVEVNTPSEEVGGHIRSLAQQVNALEL
ncbi:2-succinyl-5-enolpyruvyl-6-hydroxy-3-cyclohexene-1-carboxylic-acid synthase [Vibrio methylphosphonaticus]|uniref:2-succinyl-5-enolpyruvyl-6-hydroxy-3- cyclohexene-1-carboxylic-acid synthase n=1 Tax=Vibrio methylphosphonaticus TaxID=2946866 RepID=UPI002029D5E8|nr:2-succinyl-5-enolpyruvyl-6-hydroxy-3-cyclohexene-1-carboxylic-acid synthase [Vibrio methylphosphonaticus]MCL9776129.1 2-succinyl-5-enolpyruvyl-6-hydroxy-3-cyclohexene-1-carboxylic-acid synthase [Vibrio methylphosphonaticus]